mmetsp:Transcript_23155/g.51111  ORF Transcript_23155/g.51111 Transcript_23155/m.51111 type:complete len:818 (-) Transcript_23155:64-2517(-)
MLEDDAPAAAVAAGSAQHDEAGIRLEDQFLSRCVQCAEDALVAAEDLVCKDGSSPETVDMSAQTPSPSTSQQASTQTSLQRNETQRADLVGPSRAQHADVQSLGPFLLEDWCGLCPPRAVDTALVMQPDKELFQIASQTANNMARMQDKLDHMVPVSRMFFFEGPDAPDVYADAMEKIAEMRVPKFVEPSSRFKLEPHPLFPHLTIQQFTNLELQLRSQKVKAPLLKKLVEQEKDRREHREALEFETLREAAKKPAERRMKEELDLLYRYLQKQDFFMHIPGEVLEKMLPSIFYQQFAQGQMLFNRGNRVDTLSLILRGDVQIEERRGSVDVLSRRKQVWNNIGRGKVLGATETFEDSRGVYRAVPEPIHISSAFSRTGVDTLSISLAVVLPLLQKHAHDVKRNALKELFPHTQAKSERDLQVASRVDRMGRRLRVEDLFQVQGLPKATLLHERGEILSPGVAKLSMVVFGVVELIERGKVVATVNEGGLIGKEAAQKRPYHSKAVIASDTACLLQILVADYLQQFPASRAENKRLAQSEKKNGKLGSTQRADADASPTASDQRDDATKGQDRSAQSPPPLLTTRGKHKRHTAVSQLADALKRPAKVKLDAMGLKEREWRLLQPKKAPQRVAPFERQGMRPVASLGYSTHDDDDDEPEGYTKRASRGDFDAESEDTEEGADAHTVGKPSPHAPTRAGGRSERGPAWEKPQPEVFRGGQAEEAHKAPLAGAFGHICIGTNDEIAKLNAGVEAGCLAVSLPAAPRMSGLAPRGSVVQSARRRRTVTDTQGAANNTDVRASLEVFSAMPRVAPLSVASPR